jgi:hypothetical protein
MKSLLVALLLGASSSAALAQEWKNPLPVDSTSGYVTYRGRIEAPGQTQAQTLARASRYAKTQLTGSSAFLIDSSRVGQPVVSGAGQRAFTWRGGPAGNAGRTLHYELLLRPRAGYYEYELGNLTNETPAVQYSVAPGIATTTAPKRGAVEAVLRNPTSYDKKHRPTPALRSYCEAVNEAAQQVLKDARAALVAR